MVKGNLLPNSVLMATAEDPTTRDRLLKQTYGITDNELAYVRAQSSLEVRAVEAAKLLFKRAQDSAPGIESSQLTTLTLAAIASDTWNKPRSRRSAFDRAVKGRYKSNDLDTRLENIRNIHFLRDEVGAYSGNLFDAEKIYPNFQTSKDDFLKSVTLPLEITPKNAYLLGVLWSAALIKSSSGILTALITDYNDPIVPGEKAQKFEYLDTLIDPIFDMFNLKEKINAIPESRSKPVQLTRSGKTFEVARKAYPNIGIGSRAACTWLMDDVGLYTPERKPNVLIDEDGQALTGVDIYPTREHMLYFMAGVVDQIANVTCGYNPVSKTYSPFANYSLRDPNVNPAIAGTLTNLKTHLGAPTSNNAGEIYFPIELMREMLGQELIRNPLHLRKLESKGL